MGAFLGENTCSRLRAFFSNMIRMWGSVRWCNHAWLLCLISIMRRFITDIEYPVHSRRTWFLNSFHITCMYNDQPVFFKNYPTTLICRYPRTWCSPIVAQASLLNVCAFKGLHPDLWYLSVVLLPQLVIPPLGCSEASTIPPGINTNISYHKSFRHTNFAVYQPRPPLFTVF